MRALRATLSLSLLACLALGGPAAADDAQYPLSKSNLALKDGSNPEKRRVSFQARWKGRATLESPVFAGATLRVVGSGDNTGAHYDIVYMGRGTRNVYTVWTPLGDLPFAMGPLAVSEMPNRAPSASS